MFNLFTYYSESLCGINYRIAARNKSINMKNYTNLPTCGIKNNSLLRRYKDKILIAVQFILYTGICRFPFFFFNCSEHSRPFDWVSRNISPVITPTYYYVFRSFCQKYKRAYINLSTVFQRIEPNHVSCEW